MSTLWLHRPVGCGKTFLTTKVIESHLEAAFASHYLKVAYFYCTKSEGSGSLTTDIVPSLVRQLAWSSEDLVIDPCVVETYQSER